MTCSSAACPLSQAISHLWGFAGLESQQQMETVMNAEQASAVVVDAAFHVYRDVGPGLLESVYQAILARALERRGLQVARHRAVAFDYEGMHFSDGLRVDLLVEDCLVVELKSVETLAPVHPKQVLTYLRLMHLSLGLLINFGAARFDQAVRRIVNGHTDLASSRLRVNQTPRDR